jgi:hypothetical protein
MAKVAIDNAPLVRGMWFHLEVLLHGHNLRPSGSDNLYNIEQRNSRSVTQYFSQ